jgi:hypothetical protein
VTDAAFAPGSFFDPADLVQVKVEMVRRSETDGVPDAAGGGTGWACWWPGEWPPGWPWAAVEAALPEPGAAAGTTPQADASLSTTTPSPSTARIRGGDAGSTPACSPFLPAGTDQIIPVLTQMTLAHARTAGQRHAPAPDQEADECSRPAPHRDCGWPSTADVAAKLRRVIIAARFKASRPDQPTPEEISVLRVAWEDAAA